MMWLLVGWCAVLSLLCVISMKQFLWLYDKYLNLEKQILEQALHPLEVARKAQERLPK